MSVMINIKYYYTTSDTVQSLSLSVFYNVQYVNAKPVTNDIVVKTDGTVPLSRTPQLCAESKSSPILLFKAHVLWPSMDGTKAVRFKLAIYTK